jgi:hypothetical protein
MREYWKVLLGSMVLLAGCGGGQVSQNGAGVGTTIQVGQATIGYSGKVSPRTSTALAGSVSVVGMSGSPFTNLILAPTPRLSDTTIAYVTQDGTIYTVSDGVTTEVFSGPNQLQAATFTGDGRIAFSMYDPPTGETQIFTCYYDGSGVRRITSSGVNHYNVAWSPNNLHMAFEDFNTKSIFTCNSDGSGEKKILSNSANPAWAPDSSTLAYVAYGSKNQVYSLTPGGTPKLVTGSFAGDNCGEPEWSPDGSKIALSVDNGTSVNIYEVNPTSPTNWVKLEGGLGYDTQPGWSPDSKELVFRRAPSYTSRSWSLFTANADGSMPSVIAPADSAGLGLGASWSPYLSSRTFIGSGGALGSTASAFLWGQSGNNFGSLLAFQAKTAKTAVVAPEINSGVVNPLVWSVTADEITGMAYANSYYVPAVISTPNVSQALVSFDAVSGQVDVVAPFDAGANRNKAAVNGSSLSYSGRFAGVYNEAGKNIAPNGASQIVINGATGKLLSVR